VAAEASLEIAPSVAIPLAEIELRTSRSSGPGGQHANVTESRVEAVFDVAGSASLDDRQKARLLEQLGPQVSAVAQDARSQARNRELALERLRERLAGALREPKKRRPTKPTKGAKEQRLESKRRRSEQKRQRRKPDPES
jgi:ribosome-associated protein